MARRFCEQCGEPLGPNARFCTGCGGSVTDTTEPPQQEPTMPSTAGSPPLPGVPSGSDPSRSPAEGFRAPSLTKRKSWLRIALLFIVVLFFTNVCERVLITPFAMRLLGLRWDQWNEGRTAIVLPVAIFATLLCYKMGRKWGKVKGEEVACPECQLLAPHHLDTCTWQHQNLR